MGQAVALIVFIAIICAPSLGAEWYGRRAVMIEAFERGYAVQCVGKSGYHWECPE